jgi:hypothetical protein
VRSSRFISGSGLFDDDTDMEGIDDKAVPAVDFGEAEISGTGDTHPEIMPGRVRLQDDVTDNLETITAIETPRLIGIALTELHKQRVTAGNAYSFTVETLVDGLDTGLNSAV